MAEYIYFDVLRPAELIELVSQWQNQYPDGACFVLIAESNKDDISLLQSEFNKINYPFFGALFPELIVDAEFKKQGILLLYLKQLPYYQFIADFPADESELDISINKFANEVKEHLDDQKENNALFVLFDGMLPNIGSALERLYLHLSNGVHYFGVNAGSESFQPTPCLFDNERYIGDGMLGIVLPDHTGAVLSHNYHEPDNQITATSTDGNCINSIDWRPAFEVYQELVKKHYDVVITADNFYEYGVHFPFGISRMDGEPLVRIPVALNDDGSLFCVGEVPPNTLLTLLNAVNPGSSSTVDTISSQASLRGAELVVSFYCAGRRMHLGESAQQELTSLKERMTPTPIMGALSLGEIGSSVAGGYPLFQNATLVALPWT